MDMQQCGCCERHLLVGETFRNYRRGMRREVAVCTLCRATARQKRWLPITGPLMRQHTRSVRPLVERALRA
jgi:hypothetical protein